MEAHLQNLGDNEYAMSHFGFWEFPKILYDPIPGMIKL
jgi:hypothetical protein